MSAHFRLPVLLLLLLALGAGLAACAGVDHDTGDHMGSDKAQSVMGGDGSADGGMMDADAMFAQMMIPHHEQAIEMSDIALDPARDASPEVTALATQIKAAQDPEIAQMRAWLDEWGVPEMMAGEAMADHGGHGGMEGMLTDEQLQALRDAKGADFDRLFVDGMIAHHEGAIAMAEDVKANGDDPRVQELADAIITGQQAEIDEMRALQQG